jgi:hypothetical protein
MKRRNTADGALFDVARRRILGTGDLPEPEREAEPLVVGSIDHWDWACLDRAAPVAIGRFLHEHAGRVSAPWRCALDRAVDRLLFLADDDGCWQDGDAWLAATLVVVEGLLARLPVMPATRAIYVRQVLARTATTMQQRRPSLELAGADVAGAVTWAEVFRLTTGAHAG